MWCNISMSHLRKEKEKIKISKSYQHPPFNKNTQNEQHQALFLSPKSHTGYIIRFLSLAFPPGQWMVIYCQKMTYLITTFNFIT